MIKLNLKYSIRKISNQRYKTRFIFNYERRIKTFTNEKETEL